MALKFTFHLPPSVSATGVSPCPDLDVRELHITGLDGVEVVVPVTGEAATAEYTLERGPAGSTGSLYLVDIDTSGNKSTPSPVLSFPLDRDTTPPGAPGALSVASIEEV